MINRVATRATQRATRLASRRFASTESVYQNQKLVPNEAKAAEFKETYEGTRDHAKKTFGLWRNISIFVCIPALVATAISSYNHEMRHAEHRVHMSHIPDDEMPREFEFQNLRIKPYFWGDGDKTLFWHEGANRHVVDE
jgi:cytochrome c oxidase subunit 6a